jgi:hypothetical protein
LTIRFDAGQLIDPASAATGIQIVRSGGDGTFGNGDPPAIVPGFVGIGDNPNEIIVRFADALPDDFYQLTNLGHETQASLSYLVSGVSPEWAESLGVPRRGVVRFGPRDRAQRRYSGRWNVQDTVLPHDPAELRA